MGFHRACSHMEDCIAKISMLASARGLFNAILAVRIVTYKDRASNETVCEHLSEEKRRIDALLPCRIF